MSHAMTQPQAQLPTRGPASSTSHWSRLRAALPIAAVVVGLVALAVWGHTTDWALPKFSSLMGNGPSAAEPWCKDHNVPEAQCIECNKSLLPATKDYGWCKEHGISQCPLEHPEVAQLKEPPSIVAADGERAHRALATRPRTENNSRCLLHQRHIQFASAEAIEKAGVDIAVVEERPMVEAVSANGEVIYDQTRSAHLASRVSGTVWRVEKQVGEAVRRGEILALVDAADVGRAKSELLQAVAQLRLRQSNLERLKPLAAQGSVPGRQLSEAQAALQEAQIRLMAAQQTLINLGLPIRTDDLTGKSTEEIAAGIQFLGLPPAVVAELDINSTTSNLFPIFAPLDGVVVACKVVPGEVVDATAPIFDVADVRRMWLMLEVRQEDVRFVTLGQHVLFRTGDRKDEPDIPGGVGWISTAADEQTRTVKVRVDLPNTDGRLRANTFGTGRIVLRDEPRAIVVPTEAVHSDGCCSVVFVRDKNFFQDGAYKFFHIRQVRLGVQNGDATEIIAGVLPGEVIASKNSVVLEAQLLKGNLGAGCCEACAPKK